MKTTVLHADRGSIGFTDTTGGKRSRFSAMMPMKCCKPLGCLFTFQASERASERASQPASQPASKQASKQATTHPPTQTNHQPSQTPRHLQTSPYIHCRHHPELSHPSILSCNPHSSLPIHPTSPPTLAPESTSSKPPFRATLHGPFSAKRANCDEQPGPPESHITSGALEGFLNAQNPRPRIQIPSTQRKPDAMPRIWSGLVHTAPTRWPGLGCVPQDCSQCL